MHYPRLLSAVLLTALLSAPFSAAVRADEPLVAVSHAMPMRSLVAKARLIGRQPADEHVAAALILPLRNQTQLQQFIQNVTTPGNPLYGHYLTPAQFTAQYGPTQADYDTVVNAMKAQGLTVRLHGSRTIVGVSGRSADMARAFHVHFNQYVTAKGRSAYANDAAPLVTPSVAARINGIVGLDNFLVARPRYVRRPEISDFSVAHLVGNDSSGGLTPTDIKRIYDLNTIGLQGEGQSIALAELDGYDSGDIRAYIQKFNLPIDPNNTAVLDNIYTGGFDGTPGGDQGEVVLDIDMALALVPRAERVYVYESYNDNADNLQLFQEIADDDFAKTVSFSYGIDATGLALQFSASQYQSYLNAESAAFQQMAAQGQSFFSAAGDSGAYDAYGDPLDTAAEQDAISVDDPPENPYVTAVGGTTLSPKNPGTSSIDYGTESSWGEPAGTVFATPSKTNIPEGGGGGFSLYYPKPYYQYSSFSLSNPTGPVGVTGGSGAVASTALLTEVELLEPGYPTRDLPDVSLNANPNSGYAVFVGSDGDQYPDGFEVDGGTSAAAPLWAAFTALVNEARAAGSLSVTPGSNPGTPETPVGFINPLIYEIGFGKLGNYSQDMHDIADYSNNLVYLATKGFDDSTGWGSFNGGNLLNELASLDTGAAPGTAGGTSGSGGSGTGTTGTGGTTQVTGSVTFGGSAPSSGLTATITATSTDGSQSASATTTSAGTYTLSLETGLTYTFRVTASGYVTQSLANITLTTAAATENFALVSASSAGLNTYSVGFQMISEPYDYSSTGLDFAGIFGLTTPLAAGGPALYEWQSEAGVYAAYPTPPADSLRPGVGYWLYAPSAGLGPVVQGTPVSAPFVRTLQPGWNQIGDPFTFSEALANISVAVDSLGTNTSALSSSALVSPTLYGYLPASNSYQAVTGSLQPFVGYWLYAYQSAYLTFH